MKKMKNVTRHAKMRINERGNNVVNVKNKFLANNVRKKGESLTEYTKKYGHTPLVEYLSRKVKKYPKSKIYLYLEYVFCFSESNQLITVYPIPEAFCGEPFLNANRETFGFGSRKKALKLRKQNKDYALLTKENGKEHIIKSFETRQEAMNYGVEFFYFKKIGADFFKNKKGKTVQEFNDFLIQNEFMRVIGNVNEACLMKVVSNDLEESVEVEEELVTNDINEINEEVTKEEIEYDDYTDYGLKADDKIIKKERYEAKYKIFVLKNNAYKYLKSVESKDIAVAEVADYFKKSCYKKRFKTRISDTYKGNRAVKDDNKFYNYLRDKGIVVVLNAGFVNDLK